MSWYHQANCAETDSPYFFPTRTLDEALYLQIVREQFCDSCPVQIPCLETALAGNDWGIWAGYTEREREAMKRRAARVRARERQP